MKIKMNFKEYKKNLIKGKKAIMVAILGLVGVIFCVSGYIFFSQQIANIKSIINNPEIEIKQSSASPSASLRVPILLYHYVEYVQDKKDTIRQSLDVNPNIFDSQIKTLKNAGYNFITAKELGEVLDGKMQLPQKPILLTFDDGHWDFYTEVLPILKKYNIKATAYIVTGFIGRSDFMSQLQLQSVANSGLVDIGAHTMNHISLKGKPIATVQKEIQGSKKALEQTYHTSVVSFAYPYGSFDQKATQVVKSAGFETAVSTLPGLMQNQNNRFLLYRIRPGRRIGGSLLTYLTQKI